MTARTPQPFPLFLALALLAPAAGQAQFTPLPSRTNDVPGFAFTASPPDWRDVPLYQVITDRFYDGDPANNDDHPGSDVNPFGAVSIHGGDFKGLEQKLDYIEMLGARGVWISPVVRNVNGIFHGFAAEDFNSIDPHWGSLNDLRDLADALHARGMYLIIDVVQNHGGDLLTSTDFGYPTFNASGYNLRWRNNAFRHAPPFDDPAKFHNFGSIQDWGDPTQVLLGDFAGLDGIRTEDPQVRQDFITIYEALIAATDCDGFRVDTARHVEMGFWETFLPAVYDFTDSIGKTNFIVFCEAWLGGDNEVGPFTATNRFNSALYFPMRDTMENVFVWDQPTVQISDRINGLPEYAPIARDRLVNFLDNHDMPRYLSTDKLSGNASRLKVALTFLYTLGQVPTLYYGTEQGFEGGGDPFNREDMMDGGFESGASLGDNFNYTHPLFRYTRTLNLLRDAYPALRYGAFKQRWQAFGGGGLYVYSRLHAAGNVLVALNTSSQPQTAFNAPIGPETAQPEGTVLVDLLSPSETITVGNGGGTNRVTFSVPAYSARIWVPVDEVQPLPPSVVACAPGHAAADVGLTTEVTLDFDHPMEPTSTEAAFALEPATPGTFSWTSGWTRLLFTPAAPLTSNVNYKVELAATALATNGLALGAGYESFFDTGTELTPATPLGNFVLDGVLDSGAQLVTMNNGMALYVAYDATNGALYVAAPDAGEGNDHFIFIDDNPGGSAAPIPQWNKNGTVASDGPFLADENDNDFVAWFSVNAAAAADTGPNGGVMEGVINLVEQYGSTPGTLYLAVGIYPSSDGGTLLANFQVPPAQNFDQNIDSNEYARFEPATGVITLPPSSGVPGEVPLKQYNIDGQLSPLEQATLRDSNGSLDLYLDFNGQVLYAATEDAGEGNDHFIMVTDALPGLSNAPWAKSGKIDGLRHFLADENDNDFEGWFIDNQYDPGLLAASPVINGGYLEGSLDLVQAFGRIPDRLYVAVTPFATADGGSLFPDVQLPLGNSNTTVEADEFYTFDLTAFDTDGDGLPDLAEDLNANGIMDAGETGARITDSDGDGMTDGAEALAGTDGRDVNSYFSGRILRSTPSFGNSPRVEWDSVTGQVYSLFYADQLPAGVDGWLSTSVSNVAGTGNTMSYMETNPPAAFGSRFYFLQLTPGTPF